MRVRLADDKNDGALQAAMRALRAAMGILETQFHPFFGASCR